MLYVLYVFCFIVGIYVVNKAWPKHNVMTPEQINEYYKQREAKRQKNNISDEL